MTHQADTVCAAVTSAGVGVGRSEHSDTVQLTDFTVADSIAVANECLLGIAGQTHQGVAARRRDQEETAIHRDVVVIQTLDGATDSRISQCRSVRGAAVVGGGAIRANICLSACSTGGIVVGTNGGAVESASKLNQVSIDALCQSVASIFRVERTQARQGLHLNNVLDQTAVLIVLVDQHLNIGVALCNQSNGISSSFSRSIATGRRRDVNGITLFATEGHLLDHIGQDEVLFVGSDNLITPDFWNEIGRRGGGYRIGRGKGGVCHVKSPEKSYYRTRPSEYACIISSLRLSYLAGSVIFSRMRSARR